MDLVMITAAQMWPVRDEKDATGTHIGVPVGAQVVLVLAVANIVLLGVEFAVIMMM